MVRHGRNEMTEDSHDRNAFTELVEVYQARVFALVFRLLGRRDEAEEVVQEVFVQVFRTIPQLPGDSTLSTWIYRIAVNLCRDRMKHARETKHVTPRALRPHRPDQGPRSPWGAARGGEQGEGWEHKQKAG